MREREREQRWLMTEGWRGLVTEGGESPSEENPWFRAIGTEVKTENNMLRDARMLLGVKDMLAV